MVIALVTLVVLTILWASFEANVLRLLLASLIYLVAIAIPGKIIISRIFPRLQHLSGWVFGSILAEIVLGIDLKLSGASLIAGGVFSLLCYAAWFVLAPVEYAERVEERQKPVVAIIIAVLGFLGFFLYGQAHLADASYHFAYNPTVDLTYFQTVLTSISSYGSSRDLAQLGYHFNYPDLGYQVLSFIHRLSGAEAFDLLFFFVPLKDFLLISLALYCLVRDHVEKAWLAALAAIGFYIFNSRSLLELNVPITNPAYREGLYILFFLLWAYQLGEVKLRWILVTLSLIGLVLVKPAIWIVAAPALLLAQLFRSVRLKQYLDLALLTGVLGLTTLIFFLLFGPSQSGLASGHYAIIFGEGLSNTITGLSRISDSILSLKEIVIQPLPEISLSAILLGLVLFIPFLLQQLQHSGRLILIGLKLPSLNKEDLLTTQLLLLVLVCFGILAFVGMEYTSFLHVYLWPLLLTAVTILLAISYRPSNSRFWRWSQVLLLLADVAFAGYAYHSETSKTSSVEVPAALLDDLRSIRNLTDTSSVLATYETGLFQRGDERSYLAAAFTERRILSEGAIYGSLIMGYHENVKGGVTSPVGDTLLARRAVIDTIYHSNDPASVRNAAARYRVSHIVIRHGQGERITSPVGDTIFHGRMLTLLKL